MEKKGKGGRPKDPFHSCTIEGEKDGETIKKCKFCGHPFGKDPTGTRIKAHLGNVKGQGIAPCKEVPFDVKEAAKNAMPSSSSNALNPNIPSNSEMQQPSPQIMQSASEQSPWLPDGSLQQSNVDPMDVHSHLLLQDDTPQPPPQRCSASGPGLVDGPLPRNNVNSTRLDGQLNPFEMDISNPPPPQNMTLDGTYWDWISNLSDLDTGTLEGLEPTYAGFASQIGSCSTHDTLASQDPTQQHPGEDHNRLLHDAPRLDSVHNATIPQNLSQGGGACFSSLPQSIHPEDTLVARSKDHEGLESQHHAQKNLQGNPSNVDPMDAHLNLPLQDDTQQPPPLQRCCASGPPSPQNVPLVDPMQRTNGMPLDPLGMGTANLGHGSLIEMRNFSEDDPQCFMIQMALNTPQPNESCCSMQLASPQPMQQHPREPYQDVLQHNESFSTHSTLASRHPRRQHLGEDHNNLPDQELLQGAAGMDSEHDATTPRNLLQGGAGFDSFPDSTHQYDMAIAQFGNHEGLRSQNHVQENLQGDPRIFSLDHDPYTSIGPQMHHMHIDPLPESSDTPRSTSDQAKRNKRKLGRRPIGKKLMVGKIYQGSTFNNKVDEICKSLKNDAMSRIGVYGMGGSGKTTVMKHVNNLILEDDSMPFGYVMWVTVSQDHTIPKLQRILAGELHITLPLDEDQVVARAATLYEKMRDMCYVLILDDVWDEIDLEKVGIPEPSQENGCKLILTTRSHDVYNKMDCKPAIELVLFTQEEAWELFKNKLNVIPEDSIVQDIMKEVAKGCARLPLAIVTIAKSMKGIYHIREWRHALGTLKNRTYGFTDMEKNVIDVLKFSYNRLSEQLQQCLLSCALFPEDCFIKRAELIEMLITDGHIRSGKSLKSAHDQGHTILNKLVNACLLTKHSGDYDDQFVIHDLIRDMCLEIMRGHFLVKCRSEFPPEEHEYTEVLEKVSLMNSEFKEIPLNMVPNCPKLSTLLLSENKYLTRISDSFFTNFPRLKVLNLSGTSIQELPSSVTNLVSLNALVLRECYEITHMPCLTPLKALKQLDLYKSGIEEAPEGLEELLNLTYLDLEYTEIKMPFSSSILTNLVKLQHLKLPGSVKIMMKDVKELKKLEVFKVVFANWEEFSEYFNSGRGLFEYEIKAELTCLGAYMSYKIFTQEEEGMVGAVLRLSSEVIGKIPSPEIVRDLELRGIYQRETRENGELKGIFVATILFPFSNLVKLKVEYLEFTKDLISAFTSVVESKSSPKVLLPCFENLQEIEIIDCWNLESILVSTANPTEEEEESNNPISFPNLRKITLMDLPNLRSICDGTLNCPSIESILVFNCPKLKRLPLQVPPPPVLGNNNNNNSGQLSSPPPPPPLSSLKGIYGSPEWWESLEWDQQPHAKALLQPYLKPGPWRY